MGTKAEMNKIPIKAVVKRLFALELPFPCKKNAGRISANGNKTNVPFVSFSVVGKNRQHAMIRKSLKPILFFRYKAKITAIEQIIAIERADDTSSVPVTTSHVSAPLY